MISADSERKIVERFRMSKLQGGYLPLGKFKLLRVKETQKGFLIKRKERTIKKNYFYVDLTEGYLYWAGTSLGMFGESLEIRTSDIVKKLINLQVKSIEVLGQLLEQGSTPYHELNADVLDKFVKMDMVEVYKPKTEKTAGAINFFMDEMGGKVPEIRTIKKQVQVTSEYYIKIEAPKYNLTSFLDVCDTIDGLYNKEPIKYPIDKISGVMGALSGGDVDISLEEIIYIPFLTRAPTGEEEVTHDFYFPVCFKGDQDIKRYEKEVKLEPISLSVEMGVTGAVPVEKQLITFADVGGLENAKKEIRDTIIYPFTQPELSERFRKGGGGGILLYGPPGCGKTQIARAAVGECGVSFFNVNISDILQGEGDEAKNIHAVFEQANKNAPAIIFFDEIDALCSRKGSLDGIKKRILNQFLMDMSGVEGLSKDLLIIASTDTPWDLDPALRRSGRFTKQIFISPPDFNARVEIFKIHAKDRPIGNIDFEKLAELTDGYSAADIEAISNNATNIPWEEAVHGGEERDIKMDDFLEAITQQKSTLIPWFKIAGKQIRTSGEEETYKDLFNTILEFDKKKITRETTDKFSLMLTIEKERIENARKNLVNFQSEKENLEKKIELAKTKHQQGELDEEIYKDIIEDYQKRLIEIELKLKEIQAILGSELTP